MESHHAPDITVETIWRTILITDARNSSRAYRAEGGHEGLVRIEQDRALFGRIAADHGGEEVRDRGDGSMFAFPDPVAAVRAAITMQTEIARINAAQPEGTLRLLHRMGIHMGQLKVAITHTPGQGGSRQKMSGDIVMFAARLESAGHPGEVCVSDEVYRTVRDKISHELGSFDAIVKGYDRPIRCWSTRLDRTLAHPLTPEEEAVWARQREERRLRDRWAREKRQERGQFAFLVAAGAVAFLTASFAGVKVVQAQREAASRREFAVLATGHERHVSTKEAKPKAPVRPGSSQTVRAGGQNVAARDLWDPRDAAAPSSPTPRRTLFGSGPRPRTEAGASTNGSELFLSSVSPAARPSSVRFRSARRGAAANNPVVDAPIEEEPVSDDIERFERAREWLTERLESESLSKSGGIALSTPIAGFSVLSGVGPEGVTGYDRQRNFRQVAYADLSPSDFASLLRSAVTSSDPPPERPEVAARGFAAWRGGA